MDREKVIENGKKGPYEPMIKEQNIALRKMIEEAMNKAEQK
jgi:hypothetical protein